MKFNINRDQILKPLQQLCSVASNKALPILGNVLLKVDQQQLQLICSDMEVELQASLLLEPQSLTEGAVTVSAQKLLDICKGLNSEVMMTIESMEDQRLKVTSGRSRYHLATLPVQDFPSIESWQSDSEFSLTQGQLDHLINMTKISMPANDVRFYLNGMLFEAKDNQLRTVTTDGHRMSTCLLPIDGLTVDKRVIVPRKTITELSRLLVNFNELITLKLNESNIRIVVGDYIFTSKLVDGNYPDYSMVIPRNPDKIIEANREEFKQICTRVAILSSDQRGVRLQIESGQIRLTNASNSEYEEGEEFLTVDYQGEPLDVGFNVTYLIDILSTIKGDKVRLSIKDPNLSVLFEDCTNESSMFVVMPLKI